MMMEGIFLGVLCLSGWVSFSTCHQYHFVSESMNWTEAQTYCREKYTDLATIENTDEMNELISTVSSAGHSSEVWIGLYSKIDWRWSDGYTGRGAEYSSWNPGEPNFHGKNEFCVCIRDTAKWSDVDCSRQRKFVCYRGKQLDPEFVFVNQSMSWPSAQRHCRENFRDLVTVTNNTQNQEIQKLAPARTWPWIGLFRDPQIYWSDGSGSSFTYWSTAPKPLGSKSVVCGAAALQRSGRWTVCSCETKLPFVCHSVPPPPAFKRQIFKVKIRRDSSVDLNDPAVQAEILKKFEDRLKENGVSEVTLKWRKQPDGKVFHKEGETSQKKKKKTEL